MKGEDILEFRGSGKTLLYSWEIDENGYMYLIPIGWKGKLKCVFICNIEVSIHTNPDPFKDQFTQTNISPEDMFGQKEFLSKHELKVILKILVNNGMDGYTFPKTAVAEMYERYLEGTGE